MFLRFDYHVMTNSTLWGKHSVFCTCKITKPIFCIISLIYKTYFIYFQERSCEFEKFQQVDHMANVLLCFVMRNWLGLVNLVKIGNNVHLSEQQCNFVEVNFVIFLFFYVFLLYVVLYRFLFFCSYLPYPIIGDGGQINLKTDSFTLTYHYITTLY